MSSGNLSKARVFLWVSTKFQSRAYSNKQERKSEHVTSIEANTMDLSLMPLADPSAFAKVNCHDVGVLTTTCYPSVALAAISSGNSRESPSTKSMGI